MFKLTGALMKPKEFRLDKAKLTPGVCPYCSVGCAVIIYTINGRIVNIEGDPQSPHSEGCLCPKDPASSMRLNLKRFDMYSLHKPIKDRCNSLTHRRNRMTLKITRMLLPLRRLLII
ncbi:MAG: hypothetical protein JRE72_10150, partial [Deltaproteobacteria bacterium]|nr:hypothetical protein [Deltaproteobacteria bacterium]